MAASRSPDEHWLNGLCGAVFARTPDGDWAVLDRGRRWRRIGDAREAQRFRRQNGLILLAYLCVAWALFSNVPASPWPSLALGACLPATIATARARVRALPETEVSVPEASLRFQSRSAWYLCAAVFGAGALVLFALAGLGYADALAPLGIATLGAAALALWHARRLCEDHRSAQEATPT